MLSEHFSIDGGLTPPPPPEQSPAPAPAYTPPPAPERACSNCDFNDKCKAPEAVLHIARELSGLVSSNTRASIIKIVSSAICEGCLRYQRLPF